MKEKPIIFNSEMVKAILEGRKTQTRRVIKGVCRMDDEPWNKDYKIKDWFPCPQVQSMVHIRDMLNDQSMSQCLCPYGEIGDRLWVKETWADVTNTGIETIDGELASHIYKAEEPWEDEWDGKWKSSRFMPRKYSRITLEITDIRVERLQEISNRDIWAEGNIRKGGANAIEWFLELWNSIHKKEHRWEDNCWVWVIKFKRIGGENDRSK